MTDLLPKTATAIPVAEVTFTVTRSAGVDRAGGAVIYDDESSKLLVEVQTFIQGAGSLKTALASAVQAIRIARYLGYSEIILVTDYRNALHSVNHDKGFIARTARERLEGLGVHYVEGEVNGDRISQAGTLGLSALEARRSNVEIYVEPPKRIQSPY